EVRKISVYWDLANDRQGDDAHFARGLRPHAPALSSGIPVMRIPAPGILYRMLIPIRRAVIASTVRAFESGPASTYRAPAMARTNVATRVFASRSSPQTSTSHSIGSVRF